MEVVKSGILSHCYGVLNTLKMADECIESAEEKGCPCYSIGSLIHNNDVLEKYRQRGMNAVHTPEGLEPGIALIRAHGIPDAERRAFIKAGFNVVDSTCPTVRKGAELLKKAVISGKKAIIMGVSGHAETIGLLGVETEEGKTVDAALVCNAEQAKSLIAGGGFSSDDPVFVVTQTTFPESEYTEVKNILASFFRNIVFGNKPCPSCKERKLSGFKALESCDAAVVVGGCKSENTNDLAGYLGKSGKPVFLIENASSINEELSSELAKYKKVALCSGSSTPMWVIDEVSAILNRITE